MPTNSKTYKAIYWSLIFLFLGVLSSPTVVALYHIVIFIPLLLLLKQGHRIKLSKSSWALIALFIWGFICTIYNFQELKNIHKSFGELKYYLFGVALIIPLKFFLEQNSERKIKIILNTFWVVLIIAFFVGISRAWWRFDPVKMQFTEKYTVGRSGGFLNYMRYGYASSFIVLLSVSAALNITKLKVYITKPLFFMASLLSLAAIFTAKTRGALLALMVGLPIVLYKYRPKVALSIIGSGVLFVVLVIYQSFWSSGGSRFININDHSNFVRTSQFYTAVKAISERPVMGWGADQFSYQVKDLKKKYQIWADYYSGHSHNIILEHGVSFGVIGALLLILFLVLWFIEMVKFNTGLTWAIASYIVAFSVSGQLELLFDNANSHILFFLYSFSQAHVLINEKE